MTTLRIPWKHYPKTGSDESKDSRRQSRAILVKRNRFFRAAQASIQNPEHGSPELLVDFQAETPPPPGVPFGLGELEFEQSFPGGRMLHFLGHGERFDEVNVISTPEVPLASELKDALVLYHEAFQNSALHVNNSVAKVYQSWIGTRLFTESCWEVASRSDVVLIDNACERHDVSNAWKSLADLLWSRARSGLKQSQLTDPEQLLDALDARHPDLTTLILFAESMQFNAEQQTRLLPHLIGFVEANRATTDNDELVALGSAIRKLIAYLPFPEFDTLSDLLGSGGGVKVANDAELELAKGIVYRLSWDEGEKPECPRLRDDLLDLAMFHSSKRVVDASSSAAIALNATIALAFLGDERSIEFAKSLSRLSLSWFASLVRTRVRRLLSKWQKDKRNTNTLGLLPNLLDAIQ